MGPSELASVPAKCDTEGPEYSQEQQFAVGSADIGAFGRGWNSTQTFTNDGRPSDSDAD